MLFRSGGQYSVTYEIRILKVERSVTYEIRILKVERSVTYEIRILKVTSKSDESEKGTQTDKTNITKRNV